MQKLKKILKMWFKFIFVGWAVYGISDNFVNWTKHIAKNDGNPKYEDVEVHYEFVWWKAFKNFRKGIEILSE